MKPYLMKMNHFRVYAITAVTTLLLAVCMKASSQNSAGSRDLPLLDLHGPVKSVVMDTPLTGEATFLFDRTGRLISIDDETIIADCDPKYNPEGRLKEFYMWMAINSASYQNGHLYKFRSDYRLGTEIYIFTYNANGEIVKITKKEGDATDDEKDMQATTIPITILQRDSHGNWTKCKYPNAWGEIEIKERTIIYYE